MSVQIKNKNAVMCEYGTLADKLSTNSYVDVGIWGVASFRTKILRFSAVTFNLLVNILGSYDGVTFDQIIEADLSVTTSAVAAESITSPYTHIKVQVKAASAGSQGTLSTKYFGSWL